MDNKRCAGETGCASLNDLLHITGCTQQALVLLGCTKATGEGGRRKQAVQPCQHKLASVLSEELRQQAVVLGSTDCFGFGGFDLFLEELPEA